MVHGSWFTTDLKVDLLVEEKGIVEACCMIDIMGAPSFFWGCLLE
jgi:hypothetical protein